MENNVSYEVKNIEKETYNVFTLTLVYDGTMSIFKAGQFITIFFPETGHLEGKSYSISKVISKNSFNITVKGVGLFSNKIISLNKGDKINASFPYGYFYSESKTNNLVLIAGGIGIAPLFSIIKSSLEENKNRKISLFYSVKKVEDLVFRKELNELSKMLNINYYITQEKVKDPLLNGRISLKSILEETSFYPDTEFFVCGSISFVRDYWRGLRSGGINEEKIYTEAFF